MSTHKTMSFLISGKHEEYVKFIVTFWSLLSELQFTVKHTNALNFQILISSQFTAINHKT